MMMKMKVLEVIVVILAIATATVLALDKEPPSTRKPEDNKTENTTTETLLEKKTEHNVSLSTTNVKRSINYGYNPQDPKYNYNSFIPNIYQSSRHEPKNKKGKSRNRKSRQRNRKGRGRKIFDSDNNTPQVKIQNTKPIININFDSVYKKSKNENANVNMGRKKHETKNRDKSQQENRKSEPKKTELEHVKSNTQNKNAKLDQQTNKLDPKKIEAVNQSILSEDIKLEHVSTKPEDAEKKSKTSNQETKVVVKNVEQTSNESDVVPKKIDDENIKSQNTEPKEGNEKLELNSQLNITNKLKKTDTESEHQNGTSLKEIQLVNLQNQTKLKEVIPENKTIESIQKPINLENVEAKIKNQNSVTDKNNSNTSKDAQLIPVKTETIGDKKIIENKHALTENKKTEPETINSKTDPKKVESGNNRLEVVNNLKPSHFNSKEKAKQDKKNSDLISTKSEAPPKISTADQKTNETGFTSTDLDSLLSDLGIEFPEPLSNISPENKPISPKKQLRPTTLEQKISKQELPEKKVIRNTPLKSKVEKGKSIEVKSVQSKESKAGPKNITVENQKKPEPTTRVFKTEIGQNVSENKFNVKVPRPDDTSRNNKTLELRQTNFNSKTVEVKSNKFVPKSEITEINKKPLGQGGNPPLTQIEQSKSKREYKISSEQKKPEIRLATQVPSSRYSGFGKPISENKKILITRDHRQHGPIYKRKKLDPPLSKPAPNSRKSVPRIETEVSNDHKAKSDFPEIGIKFESPDFDNRKINPGYTNRDPKYRIPEPEIQRSESKYKNSQFAPGHNDFRKTDPKYNGASRFELNGQLPQYENDSYDIRRTRKGYQETKTAHDDLEPKRTKLRTELKRGDPKFRSTTYKDVRPRSHKEVREYEKTKPIYKESGSRYNKPKPSQEILETEYKKFKPRYEKYRPERKIEGESGRSRPGYRFKGQEERKSTIRTKYLDAKVEDEPEYHESKIEYKISETKDKNSDKLKFPDFESDFNTTDKFQIEIKTVEPDLTTLEPESNGGNTTENKSFFYKVINKWW